jgi:hypothetical protein
MTLGLGGCVSLVVLSVLFVGCLAVLGSGGDEQGVSSEQTSQQAPEQASQDTSGSEKESSSGEEKQENSSPEPAPDPPTTEELVRKEVFGAFGAPRLNNVETEVSAQDGCYQVVVRFHENTKDAIEADMHNVYQNVYGNERLRSDLCSVTITADGDVRAPGERWHREKVLTTSLGGEEARSLNWQQSYNIDFSKKWTVLYINPALQRQAAQARARDRLERRVDCLEDRGLFDIDYLCP